MLGLLQTCFPDRIDEWAPRLRELIPSYGETLNTRPDVARATIEETATALGITAV
jgi:malate dehydrogenase (quinone)